MRVKTILETIERLELDMEAIEYQRLRVVGVASRIDEKSGSTLYDVNERLILIHKTLEHSRSVLRDILDRLEL